MFRIGEFSKVCQIPVSALRYYADIGLLTPARIDEATGYRYYSADQLPRLNRILALRDLGLSLDQIRQTLDESLSAEEMRGMLRLKQAEISQHVDNEQARLKRVAARLRQIEKEGKMPEQEVVLKQTDAQYVLAIREIIPTPEHVGVLLGESYGAVMQRGIQPSAPPIAIFHDGEFKPADMDVEIGLPVAANTHTPIPLDGDRSLVLKELPAAAVASIIHQGPYDTLSASYTAIGQWIEANGYRITGASREVYLTDPDSESGPLTEIQFPVMRG